jgi:hypothetical protein
MTQNERLNWVTPTLVRKPVSETFSGLGMDQDARGGEVQS